jgi:hypothetical protein
MLKGFTRWFLAWFLVCFLAAVILLCLSLGIRVAAATETAGSKPVTDPRPDVVTALQATGPHPSVGDQLAESRSPQSRLTIARELTMWAAISEVVSNDRATRLQAD